MLEYSISLCISFFPDIPFRLSCHSDTPFTLLFKCNRKTETRVGGDEKRTVINIVKSYLFKSKGATEKFHSHSSRDMENYRKIHETIRHIYVQHIFGDGKINNLHRHVAHIHGKSQNLYFDRASLTRSSIKMYV